jgi:hypothetical protein
MSPPRGIPLMSLGERLPADCASGPTVAAGASARKGRGRRVQIKRVLTKLQEQVRMHPNLPVEIPPCVSDHLSKERLLEVQRELDLLAPRAPRGTWAHEAFPSVGLGTARVVQVDLREPCLIHVTLWFGLGLCQDRSDSHLRVGCLWRVWP